MKKQDSRETVKGEKLYGGRKSRLNDNDRPNWKRSLFTQIVPKLARKIFIENKDLDEKLKEFEKAFVDPNANYQQRLEITDILLVRISIVVKGHKLWMIQTAAQTNDGRTAGNLYRLPGGKKKGETESSLKTRKNVCEELFGTVDRAPVRFTNQTFKYETVQKSVSEPDKVKLYRKEVVSGHINTRDTAVLKHLGLLSESSDKSHRPMFSTTDAGGKQNWYTWLTDVECSQHGVELYAPSRDGSDSVIPKEARVQMNMYLNLLLECLLLSDLETGMVLCAASRMLFESPTQLMPLTASTWRNLAAAAVRLAVNTLIFDPKVSAAAEERLIGLVTSWWTNEGFNAAYSQLTCRFFEETGKSRDEAEEEEEEEDEVSEQEPEPVVEASEAAIAELHAFLQYGQTEGGKEIEALLEIMEAKAPGVPFAEYLHLPRENEDAEQAVHALSKRRVGGVGLLKWLLEQKADVHSKDRYGNTALHHAVSAANYFMCAALRDAGAADRTKNAAGYLAITGTDGQQTGKDAWNHPYSILRCCDDDAEHLATTFEALMDAVSTQSSLESFNIQRAELVEIGMSKMRKCKQHWDQAAFRRIVAMVG
eukprot:TRINITY_DN4285_c1_g1_i1.p1 TRINITY_DN4285_c1_g1~~TRINITY_DN4285_c1_g1_i1.p1  ORF type:complete len:594 (-),score=146.23 TRINITY_DN4285_c1_g1_i1:281-2062(-)